MATLPEQQPSQQNRPVSAPEPVELWMGTLGPKIKPEPIEKTWRHDTDPTRRRATFGAPYPNWEVTIDKSADVHTKLPGRFENTKRRTVQGVRLNLPVSNLILGDADFRECKFHRPNAQNESKVSVLTFKGCTFARCMLGGTVFRNVTFENCAFGRCDFGGSQFIECQFLESTFVERTAENSGFFSTEIDPTTFLKGTPPPVYNYNGRTTDGEETVAQVVADWVEVQRKLAARLLASNVQIHQTNFSDRGLYELKRAEVEVGFQTLRAHPLKGGWYYWPLRALHLIGTVAVLKATRGGTSLFRLLVIAVTLVLAYAAMLSRSHVKFMNQDCHLSSISMSFALQQLARAASLFLAIGYTAFGGGAFATVLLTAGAVLGLFWYALVAAVVNKA